MKLSEKNKILSQVSEVLSQCQSLIQSLSRIDVIDDIQIQSTTVKQMSIKSRSRNSCLVLPNVQSSCQEFTEVPASEDVFNELRETEHVFTKDIIIKSLEFLDSTFPDLAYNKDWKKINARQVFDDLS